MSTSKRWLTCGVAALAMTGVGWCTLSWGAVLWWHTPLQVVGMPLYRLFFLFGIAPELFIQKLLPTGRLFQHAAPNLITCLLAAFTLCIAIPWLISVCLRRRSRSIERAGGLSRRRFVAESVGAAALTVGAGIGAYSIWIAPQRLHVRRYDAPIRDLPPDLDGLTITQLSDTHYGPFVPLHFLKWVVSEVNALGSDLIVCTGDYAHQTPLAIGPGIEVLSALRAPLGVAAVLGNHDYWEGREACQAAFRSIGVPLLENASLSLGRSGLGAPDSFENRVCLAGVVDLWTDKPSVSKAKAGVPDHVPTILLSHNPDFAELATNHSRVDLMLSGHTHGGQVRFPGWGTPIVPSRYGQKYAGGWVEGPHWPVVVNRGVGMAVLPLRFRVPPEVCVITLRRA